MIALVGCSDDGNNNNDAGTDGPPAITLDCPTYCGKITANCTGANAQYGGSDAADATAHCMTTCAKFPVGAVTDTGGQATLGCRINHADNAVKAGMTPEVHCPHAGPAGDKIDAAGTCGSPCANFCQLEIAVCGLAGAMPTGQYASMAACMTACANFDKTHPYTVNTATFPAATPRGDSLACRMYHTTNAAVSAALAVTHCPHTQMTTTGMNPCAGTPVP
jgi:hypothetical protein